MGLRNLGGSQHLDFDITGNLDDGRNKMNECITAFDAIILGVSVSAILLSLVFLLAVLLNR